MSMDIKPGDKRFWLTVTATPKALLANKDGVMPWAVYEAVTSPEFFTVKGISITVVLLGLVIVFLSVVRERYHESKDDPYKEVEQ